MLIPGRSASHWLKRFTGRREGIFRNSHDISQYYDMHLLIRMSASIEWAVMHAVDSVEWMCGARCCVWICVFVTAIRHCANCINTVSYRAMDGTFCSIYRVYYRVYTCCTNSYCTIPSCTIIAFGSAFRQDTCDLKAESCQCLLSLLTTNSTNTSGAAEVKQDSSNGTLAKYRSSCVGTLWEEHLDIAEQSEVFPPTIIGPSGSILSKAT
jgi:hypothetical protein